MARLLDILSQAGGLTGQSLPGSTLSFFEAGPTSTKLSTFQDEALTLANDNPLPAGLEGRFPDIFLKPQKYYVEFRDKDGKLLDAQDNVTGSVIGSNSLENIAEMTALVKSTLLDGDSFPVDGYFTRGDGGGGRFFFDASNTDTANGGTIIITDEGGTGRWIRIVEDSLTPKQFGAKADGTTDNSITIQAWADHTYANGLLATDDGGHYKHGTTITLAVAQNRWTFNGAGCGDKQNFLNTIPAGTVFEYTGSSGVGWQFGDGSTTNIQAFNVNSVAFWGNTSGDVVNVDKCQAFNKFDKIFVGQNGTGNGWIISDSWVSSIRDVFVQGPENATGIGFQWVNNDIQAGVGVVHNLTGDGFQRSVIFGDITQGNGVGLRAIQAVIQGNNSDEGVVIGEAVADCDFVIWTEQNNVVGLRVFNEVDNCTFRSYHAEDTATEADIVIGKSGGTALEKKVSRCTFSPTCATTNLVSIQIHPAADAVDNVIDRPKLIPNVDTVGVGIAFTASNQNGLKVIRPIFGSGSKSFANDTTGSVGNVEEFEVSGQDGLLTRNAPYVQNAPFTIGQGMTTLETLVTSSQTLTDADTVVQRVTTAAATIVMTLPDNATFPGMRFLFIKNDAGAGKIAVTPAGSDVIVTAVGASGAVDDITTHFGATAYVSGGNGVWYQENL